MNTLFRFLTVSLTAFILASFCTSHIAVAKTYALNESASDDRVYIIKARTTVTGQLKAATRDKNGKTLPLKVNAMFSYQERRLSGTGRNAATLRTIRYYQSASAEIEVSTQTNYRQLSATQKTIVAQGTSERVLFHSPTFMMKPDDLELLNVPGDSLAILGLLPEKDVEISESWYPSSWVIQMLTSTEAINKSKLVCQLKSVKEGIAKVTFSGSINGATSGTDAVSTVKGFYLFDIDKKHINSVDLTQTEKRSVGVISPGMDVIARMKFSRSVLTKQTRLTDKIVQRIPLEPNPALLLITMNTAWNNRITWGRGWKVFQRRKTFAVLRLLEKGSFIAQCNVSEYPTLSPGEHLSKKSLQQNIRKELGATLGEIEKTEVIDTGDNRYLCKVTATGKSNKIEMHWIHYLCSAPNGRQTMFTFAVESKLLKKLAGRDLAIVKSLQFLKAPQKPQLVRP